MAAKWDRKPSRAKAAAAAAESPPAAEAGPTPLTAWSAEEVGEWLEATVKLPQYREKLAAMGADGFMLDFEGTYEWSPTVAPQLLGWFAELRAGLTAGGLPHATLSLPQGMYKPTYTAFRPHIVSTQASCRCLSFISRAFLTDCL